LVPKRVASVWSQAAAIGLGGSRRGKLGAISDDVDDGLGLTPQWGQCVGLIGVDEPVAYGKVDKHG
jgi:hypothetical protein